MRSSPLLELTRMRMVTFLRDPGALFWVFGFPLVLAFVLGLAFRNRPPDPIHVVVVANAPLAQALKGDGTLNIEEAALDDARWRLRRAQVDVLVQSDGASITYRYDETRPEGRVARLAVERAIERSNGRVDTLRATDEKVSEPGSRYIDFLVPGLIGMNLMGSSLWAIAYGIVDARKKKLLKRLAATPMKRSDYLLSILLSRVVFLVFETVVLIAIGWLAFGVAVQGSFAAVGLLALLGGLAFAGIALLIGALATSTETAGGLMNLVMMPMYLLSGAFFSSKHFPDVLQPFIKALPLTALNDSLRAVINEAAPLSSQWAQVAVLLAWGLLPFFVALRVFRWQ
ncbi:MAG: ABC transporter permease [Archangiaceae bacterium]|nr:ABC transporter permease [Archangiaceae bacterium]